MNVTSIQITPAQVSSPTAEVRDGRPRLSWKCETRDRLAGFIIYSATTTGGLWTRCNNRLIAVEPRRDLITYEPHDLLPGQTKYYRLMSVDLDGTETDQGFVKLTAPGR
jgi:hypothetical protein